jgi:hypothetical protein
VLEELKQALIQFILTKSSNLIAQMTEHPEKLSICGKMNFRNRTRMQTSVYTALPLLPSTVMVTVSMNILEE